MTRIFQRVLLLLAVGVSLTASGQGTIVHYDPVDIPVFGLGVYTYDFDLNADGVTDFQFRASNGQFMVIPLNQNAALAIPATPPDLGGFATALQSGAIIGSSSIMPVAWVQGTDTQFFRIGPTLLDCFTGGCFGEWQGVNSDAYMGAQFYIGSEIHYGWVHLRAFDSGGYIKEWAYDTVAGEGILAGAVPEPSMWGLSIAGAVLMLVTKGLKTKRG